MSKAVMLSIRPEWVARILSGEKTLEIRKTRPKLEMPFKCYIYQTGKKSLLAEICGGEDFCSKNGLVVAEFVCDLIIPISFWASDESFFDSMPAMPVPETCLTDREIVEYLGNGKTGYCWHISNLQVYDKPNPLSEFRAWNRGDPEDLPCAHLHLAFSTCDGCKLCGLKRPPQSWCYVEERRAGDETN